MNKKQAFDFLSKEGITAAAVQHPTMLKEWVLEWLDKFDGKGITMPLEEFKTYYREFISINFK